MEEWNILEQEVDPNAQFNSPYKKSPHKDNNESELHPEIVQSPALLKPKREKTKDTVAFLQLLQNQIDEFWSAHKEKFILFWGAMRPESRENFLRQVYPNIIQDLSDRYCWQDCKKLYRQDYDDILVLMPYLNVVDLSFQSHLIYLLDKYSHTDVLVKEAPEMVLRLRELLAHDVLPLTSKERDNYTRALAIRRGDILFLSDPDTLEFGEEVEVHNPIFVLHSTGGEVHMMYKKGCLMHLIEFHKVMECMAFTLTLLSDILSFFSTEVLSRDSAYLRNMTSLSLKKRSGPVRGEGITPPMLSFSPPDQQSTPIQALIRTRLADMSLSEQESAPGDQL